MWCKKILVAYDGSAPSKKALALARSIAAQDPEIEIVLVHVMRMFMSGTATAGMETVIVDDASTLKEDLDIIAKSLDNPTTVKLLQGTSPADLIAQCAENEGCDLIVMGSRGNGGLRGMLGSVSYAVTKNSPVTVMIAKDDD